MFSTFDRFQENLSSIKSPIEIISLLIKKIEDNNSKCHIILNKPLKSLKPNPKPIQSKFKGTYKLVNITFKPLTHNPMQGDFLYD